MPKPIKYRKIYKFSTPAGTPSSIGIGDTRVGNVLPLPDVAQHWGVLIYSPDDENGYSDTFFELYRPNGGIGVLQRSRREREQEEQHNSAIVRFTDTGRTTTLDDLAIEHCAQLVCEKELRNEYDLLNGNCQSMVNLLVNRIAYGDEVFTPIPTSSHSILGSGPVKFYTEYDRVPAVAMASTAEAPPVRVRTKDFNPDWTFAVEGQGGVWRPPDHRTPSASPPPPSPTVGDLNREGYVDLEIPEYVPKEMTVPNFRKEALKDAEFSSGYSTFIEEGRKSLTTAGIEEEWDYWDRKKADVEVDWSQWASPLEEGRAEEDAAEGRYDDEEQDAHDVRTVHHNQDAIDSSDTESQCASESEGVGHWC